MVRRPFFIFHKFFESGFIVYSQAYTNTYRPLSVLKAKYDMVRKYPEVVGISIATQPDYVDDWGFGTGWFPIPTAMRYGWNMACRASTKTLDFIPQKLLF